MLSTQARGMARLYALDVARAVAVIGMIIVNVGPKDDNGPASLIIRAAHGRASILFVVLAGVGVSILARRALTKGITRRSTLLWRGLLLLLIGLGLQLLDHGVSVILPTYAALFFLAAFVVKMPARWLFTSAAASTLLGPVIWLLARRTENFSIEPASLSDSPLEILAAILITGPYPLVVWIAPFFLGLWLGRLPLGNRSIQLRMVFWGAGTAVVGLGISRVLVTVFGHPSPGFGFDRLISSVGHSQMPLWLISSSGTALALLGVLLLVVPRLDRRIRLLVAVGQMPLTVYTAHLVVIALLIRPGPETAFAGVALSLAFSATLILFAVVWIANLRYGPLEMLLRQPPRFLRVEYRLPARHRRRFHVRPSPRHAGPAPAPPETTALPESAPAPRRARSR